MPEVMEMFLQYVWPGNIKYRLNIMTGEVLRTYAAPAAGLKRRECFSSLRDYLYDTETEKVFILYGLRRTGKTTLIRQVLEQMQEREFKKAAFIQVMPGDTLADINADLQLLRSSGYPSAMSMPQRSKNTLTCWISPWTWRSWT